MTTQTINPSTRFAAHEFKAHLRQSGQWMLAEAINLAASAEGFPHSYTDEAVRLGDRILLAAAEGKVDTLLALAADLEVLRMQAKWFAHTA